MSSDNPTGDQPPATPAPPPPAHAPEPTGVPAPAAPTPPEPTIEPTAPAQAPASPTESSARGPLPRSRRFLQRTVLHSVTTVGALVALHAAALVVLDGLRTSAELLVYLH